MLTPKLFATTLIHRSSLFGPINAGRTQHCIMLRISKLPLGLQCTTTGVRQLGTLSALLGAPPAASQDGSSIPNRQDPLEQQIEQPGCELPSLCGEPKNKLSLHRRGNRRISYYARRKHLFAHCRFCGQTGMPHELLASNAACNGQCMQAPSKVYPKEYKPPV